VCNNKDFTPEAWDYMRNKGFFGMKIPKVDTPNRP
jgi:alkylation response protein AidB-like acyl-CoA dehydrogenase